MLYRIASKVWNISKWIWSGLIIAFVISLASNVAFSSVKDFQKNFSQSFLGWLLRPGLNLVRSLTTIVLLAAITLLAWIITERGKEEFGDNGERTGQQSIPNNISSSLPQYLEQPQEMLNKSLHLASVKTIPDPPEPYVVHPYLLAQEFFGRRAELSKLDDWAASADVMLIVEAIGGVGKSALTWEWFNNHACGAIVGLAGRLWWSFYESGATMRDFVRHTLAYMTRRPLADFNDMEPAEREDMLLNLLHGQPYLLVLDGIERILIAYHRFDAPQFADDQVEQKDRPIHLRKCVDRRDGEFLQKLVTCAPSKVLISTRHIPLELQDSHTLKLIPGLRPLYLRGLESDDALALMRRLGVEGNADEMKRFMVQFDNHTLLLRVLAGHIINYRPAPGNFDTWYKNEKDALRLTGLDLSMKSRHILYYALDGLDLKLRKLLSRIAAFRYPIDYNALSLLNPYLPSKQTTATLESGKWHTASEKLDHGLTELEDRGLLHWDRDANLYDLHPLVRAYAFEGLKGEERKRTFDSIRNYFQSLPPENLDEVHELSDLHRSLGIYNALVYAERLEEAARFYGERLSDVLRDNLTAYHTMFELLMLLFPDGLDRLTALSMTKQQGNRVADLAYAHYALGQNKQALILYECKLKLDLESKQPFDLCTTLYYYARSLRDDYQMAASLHAREVARDLADAMNDIDNLAISYLNLLGIYRETGWWAEANEAYQHFIDKPPVHQTEFYQANAVRYRAQILIYQEQDATEVLRHALELALRSKNRLAQKQIHRWQGEAALQKDQLDMAAESFQEAITITRTSGDPSLAACLGGLARVRVLQGRHEDALQLLAEAFEEKDILDAFDLYNSAASVYLVLSEYEKAKKHALEAYKQARADSPPYSLWWDLERAKSILKKLGVPEPDMLAFDPNKVRPIPYEAEIQMLIAELRSST